MMFVKQVIRRVVLIVVVLPLALWLMLFFFNSFFSPISTLMLGRYVSLRSVEHHHVPIEEVSPHLLRAVVAAEDGQFCEHAGVDTASLSKQVDKLAAGKTRKLHGASTITMQTVKNLLLWGDRSFVRKALEIPLAFVVDALWGKTKVLEAYVNIAEWGEGVFGVEAAAQTYFQTSARDLTLQQAALLAASLPSPLKRNPAKPSAYQRYYAKTILRRMQQLPELSCIVIKQ